jgi:hypothetical protein
MRRDAANRAAREEAVRVGQGWNKAIAAPPGHLAVADDPRRHRSDRPH